MEKTVTMPISEYEALKEIEKNQNKIQLIISRRDSDYYGIYQIYKGYHNSNDEVTDDIRNIIQIDIDRLNKKMSDQYNIEINNYVISYLKSNKWVKLLIKLNLIKYYTKHLLENK